MKSVYCVVALIGLLTAPAAMAEQFVAQLETSFKGANARLLDSLQVVELDAFEHDGKHYYVIEAPDEAYVKAYFFALGLRPTGLHLLDADWNAPGLADLSLENRLLFLKPTPCDFCLS
ncbi:MAG: hypothetical protein AB3N23_08200 [Paracoccaceae bacterium]